MVLSVTEDGSATLAINGQSIGGNAQVSWAGGNHLYVQVPITRASLGLGENQNNRFGPVSKETQNKCLAPARTPGNRSIFGHVRTAAAFPGGTSCRGATGCPSWPGASRGRASLTRPRAGRAPPWSWRRPPSRRARPVRPPRGGRPRRRAGPFRRRSPPGGGGGPRGSQASGTPSRHPAKSRTESEPWQASSQATPVRLCFVKLN